MLVLLGGLVGQGKSLTLICASLSFLNDATSHDKEGLVARVYESVGQDEPDWVVQHEVESRLKEFERVERELDSRLDRVRQREKELQGSKRDTLANQRKKVVSCRLVP